MNRAMTKERLMQETSIHRGTGGWDAVGRMAALKNSVIAGFVRGGRFEMAQACT